MCNETLVEVTQIKGTSDTHPALSPNDEWADFQIYPFRIGQRLPSQPSGGYVREAYRVGLEMEESDGFNPYRFGLIGSSDTHLAATSDDESNFFSADDAGEHRLAARVGFHGETGNRTARNICPPP